MKQLCAAFAFVILGYSLCFAVSYAMRHDPKVKLMDGDEIEWIDEDDNQHTLKAVKNSDGEVRGLQYVTYAPKNAPAAVKARLQRMQEEIEEAKKSSTRTTKTTRRQVTMAKVVCLNSNCDQTYLQHLDICPHCNTSNLLKASFDLNDAKLLKDSVDLVISDVRRANQTKAQMLHRELNSLKPKTALSRIIDDIRNALKLVF